MPLHPEDQKALEALGPEAVRSVRFLSAIGAALLAEANRSGRRLPITDAHRYAKAAFEAYEREAKET